MAGISTSVASKGAILGSIGIRQARFGRQLTQSPVATVISLSTEAVASILLRSISRPFLTSRWSGIGGFVWVIDNVDDVVVAETLGAGVRLIAMSLLIVVVILVVTLVIGVLILLLLSSLKGKAAWGVLLLRRVIAVLTIRARIAQFGPSGFDYAQSLGLGLDGWTYTESPFRLSKCRSLSL
jgi:hypothetical protein